MPFSAWKGMEIGQKDMDLFNVANYDARIAGYRALNKEAVETGAAIPLLQSVITTARQKALDYTTYDNGWVLPQTMRWT
jgi:peptide/nickel transport system substrate-binding protein